MNRYSDQYCPTREDVVLFLNGKCVACRELSEQVDEVYSEDKTSEKDYHPQQTE